MALPTSSSAWVVLASWLAFVGGVGVAALPRAAPALDGSDRERLLAAWAPVLDEARADSATLWLGGPRACPCSAESSARLGEWAARLGVAVRVAEDAPDGIALVDGDGRLRYVGDADALAAQCSGAGGLRPWFESSAGRDDRAAAVLVTAPCPCTR
jgi:hypothetical protein